MPHAQTIHCVPMGEVCYIYATYEVFPPNDVARITVHRFWWWHQHQQWLCHGPLTNTELETWPTQSKRYSITEREALGILNGLEKFWHFSFARQVSVIVDQKALVVIMKKDIAMLSQRLWHTLLRVHQYRIKILYKHRPDLFIADW